MYANIMLQYLILQLLQTINICICDTYYKIYYKYIIILKY